MKLHYADEKGHFLGITLGAQLKSRDFLRDWILPRRDVACYVLIGSGWYY